MSIWNSCKLVGGAAAVAATGLLITPAAQAQADYDCYQQAGYQFPGGEVVIHYPDTDSNTRFRVVKGETHVNTAAETFYQNGTSLKGRITGDMEKGGNIINLTVTRANYDPLTLSGAIGPDGTPNGSFAVGSLDGNVEWREWDSPTVFACVPGSPPPIPDEFQRKQFATVAGGPADIFNIAHNDVPDPVNGIQGAKIATLPDGTQVGLEGQCKDGWCRVNEASIPQGFGFVEQGRLTF